MHYIPAQIVVLFITVHFKRISTSHFPHHTHVCSLFVHKCFEWNFTKRTHVSVDFYEDKNKTNSNLSPKGLTTSKVPKHRRLSTTTATKKQSPCLFLVMFSLKPNLDHFQMHARSFVLVIHKNKNVLFPLIHCLLNTTD